MILLRFFTLLICVATAFLTFSGTCVRGQEKSSPAKKKETIIIGWVANNPENWWKIVEAGAKKAAKELQVELVFRMPEKGDSVEQQKVIDAIVAGGANGMVVSPIDPESVELKVLAAKMPLVTIDVEAVAEHRLAHVGTDEINSGKAAAKRIKELIPEGGTVALFVGSSAYAKVRIQGLLDELAGEKDAQGPKYGKYTLFNGRPLSDDADRRKAQENAAMALQHLGAEKNVVMVGLWAYNPPAILEAVKQANLSGKVKIVAFDEDKATLEGIRKGDIDSTIVQQPFQYGYQSVKVLAAFLKDGKKPAESRIFIPHQLVTTANVETLAKKLKDYTENK